jgi:tetratricopeptide (TPR) repeat protein
MKATAFLVLAATALVCAGADKPAAAPKSKSPPPARAGSQATPADAELRKIMADDDAAQDEVENWIADAQNAEGPTAPAVRAALKLKAEDRLAGVRKRYETFLAQYPNHSRGHLAFGSFLYEQGLEQDGVKVWNRALELDPKNPAAWNNLANHFAHRGPVRKGFEYYEKAIELDAKQAQYHHSLGTVVFLFRKDAAAHFKLDEQQVFDKALACYARAQDLDPSSFTLAADIAQTFYGITPPRNDAAIAAWERALKLAPDDVERQGVHLHFARIKVNMGHFADARAHLDKVSHPGHAVVKERIAKTLATREANQAAPAATNPSPPK